MKAFVRACAVLAAICTCWLAGTLPALASGFDDPFDTTSKVTTSPAQAGICDTKAAGRKLTLADVIQISLCNNPQTRAAWASARAAAAQLGVSDASRLPTLSLAAAATHGASATGTTHTVSNSQSGSLSASYLLYDFGGREAGIDNAIGLLDAANASGDATLQTVFLNAAQAYFSVMSARASVFAGMANEASASESLDAAKTRLRIGAATPADMLQAKTALSQATLTRVQAEGTMYNALGTLANVMGLSPTVDLEFAKPARARPDIALEQDVGKLIEQAQSQRPDLAAAEARIRASKAGIASARAAGMPQLSVDASLSDSRSAVAGGNYAKTGSGSVALNLTFPLFTGFATTYRTVAAEAQLESNEAARDQLAQQVTLQVWQAWQNLRTQGEALRSADDLLASAGESEKLALGRYRAGVGNILDLLTAQGALATARQQQVSAKYNWHAARFSLAQAVGALDLDALRKIRSLEP